ncbi:hypothetical protein [Alicyclobacillus sp. SO9]|uniref:hypothetical protein n=1 Tax=Alicyclobacillus sp. SO9 TaxID=2665646 RepID=UPI0018E81C34|nr:hypothetical protein [Alicyclobacillus sp. SO9]QQE80504.1 hypothetical protein GI364_08890 [Alicyclobacillus sp. SO9]
MTEKPDVDLDNLAPIGSKILFENDLVRIWEVYLEPGEHQGFHHHTNPYVVVAVDGGDNKITSIDGTERLTEEPPGHIVYQDRGQIHNLQNIGETHYRNRLIEIKVPTSKGVEGNGKGD